MTVLKQITIDFDNPALEQYVQNLAQYHLEDSPVRYAFKDGCPIQLSVMEAREAREAFKKHQPSSKAEHMYLSKILTIFEQEIHQAAVKSPNEMDTEPAIGE
jgi:hypothetical protein